MEKSSSEQDIKHLTKLIDMALKAKASLGQKDKKGNNLLIGFLNTLNKPLSAYNQKNFLSTLISKFISSGVDIDEKNEKAYAKSSDAVLRLIKKLFDAGIRLVPGTDVIGSFAPFNNVPTHYKITVDDESKWWGQ